MFTAIQSIIVTHYGMDPVIGATTGAVMGGFYGAWGAWTTGGKGWDVAEGALLGAAWRWPRSCSHAVVQRIAIQVIGHRSRS